MSAPNCMDTISWRTTGTEYVPSWRQWLETGFRKAVRDLLELLEMVAVWSQRSRERRQLMTLDDRMLQDIGVSRSDAWREFEKPVWRK